jgi:DNA-binding MarR family transcriptional regulator
MELTMEVAQLRKKYSPGEAIKTLDSSDVSFGPASFEALDLFLVDLDRRGITLKGLHLLIHLRNGGDDLKRLSVLASAIGLTCAGLTGVADQLEDKGLAVRVIQRHDRRSIYLALTPKGSQFVNWIAASLGGTLGAPAS